MLTFWPGLLEAWLVLTSVKYHGNLYILIPLNQRLALTRLRATGPWEGNWSWNTNNLQNHLAHAAEKSAWMNWSETFHLLINN